MSEIECALWGISIDYFGSCVICYICATHYQAPSLVNIEHVEFVNAECIAVLFLACAHHTEFLVRVEQQLLRAREIQIV